MTIGGGGEEHIHAYATGRLPPAMKGLTMGRSIGRDLTGARRSGKRS